MTPSSPTQSRPEAQSAPTISPPARAGGEAPRLRTLLMRFGARPEASAAVGVIAVFAYFAISAGSSGFLTGTATANYLETAAQIGIVTCAVALLMIAGDFDISVGSMIGAGAVAVAWPLTSWHWPLWAALCFGLVISCLVGLIQGAIVMRTTLPSFIVTLAGLYVIRGLNLEITQSLTGTTEIGGVTDAAKGSFLAPLFIGKVAGLPVVVFWWIGLTLVAMVVLTRTRFGNWIYACGGDRESARRSGVPVAKVKILLFMFTAMTATLVGVLTMFSVNAANITTGNGFEFSTITAAVIGGTLLTGGFGSPIGAALGALVYGIVTQGFFYTDIDGNWVEVFLGAMLLIAVAINHYARSETLKRRGS